MKITNDIHEVMIVAQRFAEASKIISDAENAINKCFYIGWNLLSDEEAAILRKAQHKLSEISARTSVYEATKYVESLTSQNS